MHFFIDYMHSRIPTWRRNSTGWQTGNCPMCVQQGEKRPDTRGRGGVLFEGDNWRYHCFNCHYTAGWEPGQSLTSRTKKLLRGLGADESDVQRISLELLREEETTQLLNPMPKEKADYIPNWKTIELPGTELCDVEGVTPIINDGINMIVERKVAWKSNWYYAERPLQFKRRFILPYLYKDEPVGYSARYIGDPPPGTPKYLLQKPEHFIFNLDEQSSDRDFVVVTEGDFDALPIGGVSVGTNSIDENQANLLTQLKRNVIVLPDADAAGMKMVESALQHGFSVSFPEWMDTFKDANAAACFYGSVFTLASIREAAISNHTKIKVIAKRYCVDKSA